MSQHDLSIANQGFPAFRSDLNDALQALGSMQSGTTAPSATFANMLWYDTTNNIVKMRNEDNDAWISLFTLDQSGDLVSAISAATGTFGALSATGNVTLGDASTDTLNVGNGGLVKDASGNVGIGTSSPAQKLEVNTTSGSYQMRLGSGTTATAYTYDIGRSSADGYFRFYGNQTGAIGYIFGGVDGERARIDSSGSLLVGTTSATFGGVTMAQLLDARTRNSGFGLGIIGNASNTQSQRFFYDTTAVGSINITSSTTSYITSSDYRLKENVQPMVGALEKVAALKPVTYDWKADKTSTQGFIAHELQEVVPECVVGEKDAVDADGNPVYQGIDTSFLVATLTAAIQEQSALITSLTARIAALEGQA